MITNKNSGYTIISRPDYFDELIKAAITAKPNDRITIATMGFDPKEPKIHKLVEGLKQAAAAGARVELLIDAHNFMITSHKVPGPLMVRETIPKHMPPPFRHVKQAVKELRSNGVKVTITNIPKTKLSSPFAGRSHMKYALINDLVYVGGCNLTNVEDVDLMVNWRDKSVVKQLQNIVNDIHKTKQVKTSLNATDLSVKTSFGSTLLIDSGVPNQSLIMDQAMKLIDSAQSEILMTSQFLPNSTTANHLKKAHERGVKVNIITNHPSAHSLPFNVLMRATKFHEKQRMPKHFFEDSLPKGHSYLHAKLLATDAGTLIGSHNYVAYGVQAGTAEIAILVNDPAFRTEAVQALNKQLHKI